MDNLSGLDLFSKRIHIYRCILCCFNQVFKPKFNAITLRNRFQLPNLDLNHLTDNARYVQF